MRLLVNDPALIASGALEFAPADLPANTSINLRMSDGLTTALLNRADISQAIRSMRATTVRLGVAKNELLPQLDVFFKSYVAGLEGDSRLLRALENQFAEGRPSFTVGLQFEIPVGNRAARARFDRRQLELTRAVHEFRLAVEQSLTETELAIREVWTTQKEMVGKYDAMMAAYDETKYLKDRWLTFPGKGASAILLLDDLLESQERLADKESDFVRAQVANSVALIKLRREMGTLLACGPTVLGGYPAAGSDADDGFVRSKIRDVSAAVSGHRPSFGSEKPIEQFARQRN